MAFSTRSYTAASAEAALSASEPFEEQPARPPATRSRQRRTALRMEAATWGLGKTVVEGCPPDEHDLPGIRKSPLSSRSRYGKTSGGMLVAPSEPDSAAAQFVRSQYREKMIEHLFVAELWKEAWFRRSKVIEVLRSEVDGSGFDLLLECNGVQRHVQLKATAKGGRTRHQKVNTNLALRAGGCIVWVVFDGNHEVGLESISYFFFGGKPGENLPSLDGLKVAKHTKANMKGVKGERPGIRLMARSRFSKVSSASELFTLLFGE
jgi:hypothetical protein